MGSCEAVPNQSQIVAMAAPARGPCAWPSAAGRHPVQQQLDAQVLPFGRALAFVFWRAFCLSLRSLAGSFSTFGSLRNGGAVNHGDDIKPGVRKSETALKKVSKTHSFSLHYLHGPTAAWEAIKRQIFQDLYPHNQIGQLPWLLSNSKLNQHLCVSLTSPQLFFPRVVHSVRGEGMPNGSCCGGVQIC